MSFVEHHEVAESGDNRTDTRVATSRMVVSPGQVLAGILGAVISAIGVITVVRGGIDGSLNVPIVRAASFDQSSMLGLIELGLGLLIIIGALSYAARGLVVVVGVVMVFGGVVLGAAGTTILSDVGTVNGTGWAIMVAGIICIATGSLGLIIRTRHSVKTEG